MLRLIDKHADPLKQLHTLVRGLGAVCVLGVLVWALLPIAVQSSPGSSVVPETAEHVDDDNSHTNQLSADSFHATFWYEPPPARIPKRPIPAVASIRFELLAILVSPGSGNELSGLLYDPKDDQLRTMHLGDELHGYRVVEIDANGLTLTHSGSGRVRLILENKDAG